MWSKNSFCWRLGVLAFSLPECAGYFAAGTYITAGRGSRSTARRRGLFMRGAIVAMHPAGTADIQKLSMARRIGVGRAEREEAGRLH